MKVDDRSLYSSGVDVNTITNCINDEFSRISAWFKVIYLLYSTGAVAKNLPLKVD